MSKRYTYLNIVGWLYPYMINGVDFSLELFYRSYSTHDKLGYLWLKDKETLKSAQIRLNGRPLLADYIVLRGEHLENLLESMNDFDPETEDYPGTCKET